MSARELELRRRVALEAARLIGEQGIRDFALAKRKAAQRLGDLDESSLPTNREIEEALREHQRLFQGDSQPQQLLDLRKAACDAMRHLAPFEPRLVGAVLEGIADMHSAVCLHLFADTPEQVMIFLDETGIDYAEDARRMRIGHDRQAEYPVLRLTHENIVFDLTVFPCDAIRQAPLDRGGVKPMRRANLAQVETMLAEMAPASRSA